MLIIPIFSDFVLVLFILFNLFLIHLFFIIIYLFLHLFIYLFIYLFFFFGGGASFLFVVLQSELHGVL